uniref:hypothetical protein n=1 Tax=uncultured Sphingomonas sp. TaxID=158754 RepID=UPI0035CB880F
MGECEFLYGKDLSKKILDVCQGDSVKCAVAFLGQGVKAQLFPTGIGDVQIMCDISMKCTSKRALMEFGAPTGARKAGNHNLKVCDGLHGKVYISSKGAVIGSPNMSTRGLGRSLNGDWNLETGVFCTPDSDAWRRAESWFTEKFSKQSVISWKDVKRATDVARDAGRPPRANELPNSVFSRVFEYTETFDNVLFVISGDPIPDDIDSERTRTHAKQSKQGQHSDVERVSIVHDEPSVLKGRFDQAIVYWMPKKAKDQEVQAYVEIVPVPIDKADTLFGRDDWKQAWESLSESMPSPDDVIEVDRSTALRLLEDDGPFVGNAAALRERLEQIGFRPDSRSFERAIADPRE